MKYLTVGTDEITEEKFRAIQDRKDNIKPTGGLWLTEQKNINYNKWVDFILYRRYLFFYKYYNKYYNWNIPCCLATLRDKTNIFDLNSKKQLQFLMENYKSDDNLLKFEELSKSYDGIFINYLAMMRKEIDSELSKKFQTFAVDTLLLFNLNCIDFYQKGEVIIEPFDPDVELDEPSYKINIEEKKRVLKR